MEMGNCKFIHFAKQSFLLDMMKCIESPEKHLDGSSNTAVGKMKARSSINCLDEVPHPESFKHFHIPHISRSAVHFYLLS